MKPKISIVVPVYNVGPYLTKCMESLCNQTLKDIEIIAVNDCSTDDSFNTKNMKRLRRKLYRKNKSMTIIDYLLYLFKKKRTNLPPLPPPLHLFLTFCA